MSWDRMRYILWDNNCSVPPQIHMTPFTAAFAERSPYLLRKGKEREGARAEKRQAPAAQISNLSPPPPNTQQQAPPQIRCASKTPPDCKPQRCLQHSHAHRGSEKANERGELAASQQNGYTAQAAFLQEEKLWDFILDALYWAGFTCKPQEEENTRERGGWCCAAITEFRCVLSLLE
ncbi:unnamed protein product [Caretta caretta]